MVLEIGVTLDCDRINFTVDHLQLYMTLCGFHCKPKKCLTRLMELKSSLIRIINSEEIDIHFNNPLTMSHYQGLKLYLEDCRRRRHVFIH